MRLLILENFSVYIPARDGQREEKCSFSKGMTPDADKLPAGQSAEDWIAKGLAKAASAASSATAPGGAPAV